MVIGLGLYPTFLKRFKVYLAGLAAVALAVALLIPSAVLIHGRWIGVHEGKDIEANTLSQRLVVWDYCWRCFKENPLTGIGLGRNNFWPAYAEFVTFYEKFQLFHCHNAYFDMALQTGLPGLLAFLVLFGAGLVVCWRIWVRAGPTARFWGAAGFLSLAGFVVRLLWDSLYQDEHARVLWLVLGLVWAARRIEDREAGRPA
jgi:O-antigen ligase